MLGRRIDEEAGEEAEGIMATIFGNGYILAWIGMEGDEEIPICCLFPAPLHGLRQRNLSICFRDVDTTENDLT